MYFHKLNVNFVVSLLHFCFAKRNTEASRDRKLKQFHYLLKKIARSRVFFQNFRNVYPAALAYTQLNKFYRVASSSHKLKQKDFKTLQFTFSSISGIARRLLILDCLLYFVKHNLELFESNWNCSRGCS